MNHKRKRAKNRRSGCLYCKPHKANGVNDDTKQVRVQIEQAKEQIEG